MAAAVVASNVLRPNRSASQPEAMLAATPNAEPTAWITRNRVAPSGVNRNTHDSGNTVTMWNRAKLASGTNAPIRMVRPLLRTVSRIPDGCNSCVAKSFAYSGVRTMRKRANNATTLMANATKNG